MSAMASQITSLTIACSSVYSGADQRKHQSSASLAFVWGIHRSPVNSPHKGPVKRKCFLLMTSSLHWSWVDCQVNVNMPLKTIKATWTVNSGVIRMFPSLPVTKPAKTLWHGLHKKQSYFLNFRVIRTGYRTLIYIPLFIKFWDKVDSCTPASIYMKCQ